MALKHTQGAHRDMGLKYPTKPFSLVQAVSESQGQCGGLGQGIEGLEGLDWHGDRKQHSNIQIKKKTSHKKSSLPPLSIFCRSV